MASHGICHIRKGRLDKAAPVQINIADRYTNAFNKLCFYPTSAKLGNACPNAGCLAASNGVCTKRNTAQFEPLLFKN